AFPRSSAACGPGGRRHKNQPEKNLVPVRRLRHRLRTPRPRVLTTQYQVLLSAPSPRPFWTPAKLQNPKSKILSPCPLALLLPTLSCACSASSSNTSRARPSAPGAAKTERSRTKRER